MNIDHFKQKLEAEKSLLEGELNNMGRFDAATGHWEPVSPEDADTTDFREEVADRLEEDEARNATIAPLQSRLSEVVEALKRIEQGTYGTCEIGGETIEEARLEANPAAKTCTAHLHNQEQV